MHSLTTCLLGNINEMQINNTTQQNGSAQQINKGEQLCQMRQVII